MKNLICTITLAIGLCAQAVANDPFVKTYELEPFHSIEIDGPMDVRLVPGQSHSVVVEGDERLLEHVDITVEDGVLALDVDRPWRNRDKVKVVVHFVAMSHLSMEGTGDLSCEGFINAKNLKLEFEGTGSAALNVHADKLISDIEGVGNYTITGSTTYHKVSFEGVGKYDASALISDYTMVQSEGVGSVKIHAAKKLIGRASGVGSVDYWGDPAVVEMNAEGIGSINRR
jgi:hypothetical protein